MDELKWFPFDCHSLLPMVPALAGITLLAYKQGERRAVRICGVPPALRSLCPACGWLVLGDMKLFLEPSGSLLNCHEWFPIAFPFTIEHFYTKLQSIGYLWYAFL
jgi:hypothetical protein